MNNLEQEQQQLLTVENEYWVKMWEDLQGLKNDPRFKRLILEGYFKDKAVNGVSMLAADYTIANGKRSEIMEELISISRLEDFFITVENLGSAAESALSEETEE